MRGVVVRTRESDGSSSCIREKWKTIGSEAPDKTVSKSFGKFEGTTRERQRCSPRLESMLKTMQKSSGSHRSMGGMIRYRGHSIVDKSDIEQGHRWTKVRGVVMSSRVLSRVVVE